MLTNLKLRSEALQAALDELYPNQELIYDGILDYERYTQARYKIMWVLKEPYDDFDENGEPYGGGWHLRDALLPKQQWSDFTSGQKTYAPMIYSAFSILNDFPEDKDIPTVEEKPEILEAFKSIAYINIKKTPGFKSSIDAVVQAAYTKNEKILEEQIELCDPDIVIFGGSFKFFSSESELIPQEMTQYDRFKYGFNNKRLFIAAYHPSQWSVSPADYLNEIIFIAREHKSSLTKKEFHGETS